MTPTVADLGKRVKSKYPGTYDDLDDAEVGRKVKAKHPGSYDDFADTLAPVTINLTGEPAPPVMPVQAAVNRFGDTAAVAPVATRATDEERRTVMGFLANIPTSTGRLIGSMLNVPEQVQGTTALFAGMAEKSGFKKLPGFGDTNAVDALVAHYKDRYGSIEGFKKALYEDPAGVAFDAAMVLEPGAAGLRAAGLPRAAAATTRAARAINPVAQTIRAGEAALPYVVRAGEAAPTAITGAAKGAYGTALTPKTAAEAAVGWTVGQMAGPHVGAGVSTVLTGSRVARGAYRGAREALKARAAAAAEALRAETLAERPPLIAPEPPPAGPPPILPPEPVIPPSPGAPPAGPLKPMPVPQALAEFEATKSAPSPEPDITPRAARLTSTQTAAHELATEQIAQMLHDNGISAQDALTFDPSDWQNLTSSVMRGTTDVPPSLTRNVAVRLKEIERSAAPSPAPAAPPPEPQTVAQAQAEVKAAQKAAASEEAGQALRAEMGLAEGELRPPPGEAKPAPTASEKRVKKLSAMVAEMKLDMAEVEKFNTPQGRMILENYSKEKGLRSPARGEVEQIIAKVQSMREGAAATAAPEPLKPTTIAEEQAKFKAAKKAKPAKEPSAMSASEINKRLDQLDKKDSALTERMIAEGRGHERMSEIATQTDPLSLEVNAVRDQIADLRREMQHRYGPGTPSRLPRGFNRMKGFYD